MHGVKRLFAWMIPRFDASRYRVSLVSLRRRDLSEETLDALGIDITYLGKSRFDPTTLPALLRVIRAKRADVLHLHGYGATTFGRLAAAIVGLPVVLHEHANLTATPWFQKVADRMLEPVTDVAIAVSRSTATFVTEARLVRPERVRVVYLGAPVEEFGPPRSADQIAETRRSLGVAPSDFLVGSVTRLHESKGNEYLVDAARQVIDARPQARFIVFGEGPLRASLEARVRALGLGERFRFAGFVRDVAAVLWAFDLAVFPSLWEGTPLTVFEALAAARPIVATDADGLAEVLVDGANAVIVPRRDAAALAARIIELADAPERRQALGHAARRSASAYDITAFVRKMERLYDLLHRESRARHRRIAESKDMAFLTEPPIR
ncbi:MAG: glycosyltransferase [Acidobacteria bacterium]|nr:glycosyltransferase [Acidobacteriota bacterium]